MWRAKRLLGSRLFRASLASVSAVGTYQACQLSTPLCPSYIHADGVVPEAFKGFPSRAEMIQRLQGLDGSGQSVPDPEFDLLIVGAGATGVGCALDAASRGLKVALVERDDFSCGSSFICRRVCH